MVSQRLRLRRGVWSVVSVRARATASCRIAVLTISVGAATGCGDVNAALEKLSEARQLAADLLIQFTKAADAANRAVMADTDEASVAFAREAEQATQAVQTDSDALRSILMNLGYSNESQVLEQFASRFAKYLDLDRNIRELAG